jgi:hypothetical protein
MSDTEPCPPADELNEGEAQLVLAFMDEWNWTSPIEGQPLNLPNPPGVPCYCTQLPCYLNSHRKL